MVVITPIDVDLAFAILAGVSAAIAAAAFRHADAAFALARRLIAPRGNDDGKNGGGTTSPDPKSPYAPPEQ